MRDVLHNALQYGDLSFRDFVELALYHPELGYYASATQRVGKEGDYVTSPSLSPVFAFTLARLIREFSQRMGDGMSVVVDIGCGDGSLIHSLFAQISDERMQFAGVDRSLERVRGPRDGVTFATSLDAIPKCDAQLVISNELFDALPFARLVMRGEHLHELWVTERDDGSLDWTEHEAGAEYGDYFASRGIELDDGQFIDVSLEWGAMYADVARWVDRGVIVTFDYGHPQDRLFRSRARRFGTAAAYSGQRVSRDLLANPGEQDLTAHINFDDLRNAGERAGFSSLFFDRQAKFLLALGANEHELFAPILDAEVSSAEEGLELLQKRDDARRLILPDGIGEDIRVLVQAKGMGEEAWSFERKLW
jgi:SAM-dependent MidA family methyltransferase